MATLQPRTHDRLPNWSRPTLRAVELLVTATVLFGSLSMAATALGDPELVALLALAGCGLALLGLALTAVRKHRLASSAA